MPGDDYILSNKAYTRFIWLKREYQPRCGLYDRSHFWDVEIKDGVKRYNHWVIMLVVIPR